MKYPSVGLLHWPLALEIEHQGREVCEGPTRAGCGSFAIRSVRVQRLGLYPSTEAAWDTRDSLGWKFRSAVRAYPASKRAKMSLFFHKLI